MLTSCAKILEQERRNQSVHSEANDKEANFLAEWPELNATIVALHRRRERKLAKSISFSSSDRLLLIRRHFDEVKDLTSNVQ
ncbi:hypothetical protein AVEN_186676-1 [Araneus ventricosus]|uniref:Uncharacterized protein n=1 Tax=Araneus ventricosus TaxID=182803 RepID=A0A4Y2G776_ARAVE|nr:hypothetical protein AVEN_186676-1 [Araneus ventricosus]